MRPSLMNTKGWHYDTTDEQIEAAYQLLVTLNKTKYNIGYRERPDTLGGERQFHLTVPSQPHDPQRNPRHWSPPTTIVIASFDAFTNLVITPEFLTHGKTNTPDKRLCEVWIQYESGVEDQFETWLDIDSSIEDQIYDAFNNIDPNTPQISDFKWSIVEDNSTGHLAL